MLARPNVTYVSGGLGGVEKKKPVPKLESIDAKKTIQPAMLASQ